MKYKTCVKDLGSLSQALILKFSTYGQVYSNLVRSFSIDCLRSDLCSDFVSGGKTVNRTVFNVCSYVSILLCKRTCTYAKTPGFKS